MISALLFIAAGLVFFGGVALLIHALECIVNGKPFLPGLRKLVRKLISHKVYTAEIPDYSIIAALEMAEYGRVLTIGASMPIDGLPGYKWRIREDKDGDIEIKLINPKGVSCQGAEFVITRHEEAKDLENKVKECMNAMITREKDSHSLRVTKQSIIDKYNNRHVELEP